jgi:hypothetical protein
LPNTFKRRVASRRPARFDRGHNGVVDEKAPPERRGPTMRSRICGRVIQVPIVEATAGESRAGRSGWKNQHACLVWCGER